MKPPNITCPRCDSHVHIFLEVDEGLPPFTSHVYFSCHNSYRTIHGRRRCGRPVIITHDNGNLVAMFPVHWPDVMGMKLPQIVERYGTHSTTQRIPRG